MTLSEVQTQTHLAHPSCITSSFRMDSIDQDIDLATGA